MKRLFYLANLLVFILLFPKNVFAVENDYQKYANDKGYVINTFSSKIIVEEDTSLNVTETILASFTAQKHGIIRVIPYIYSSGGKSINGRMEVVSVTNEKGQPYRFSESILNQSKKLQIGDANTFVKGDKTYVIRYRMQNVVLKYNNVPEVYWNVTGREWDTVILNASAEIVTKNANIEKVKCFEGPVGSTNECKVDFDKNSAIFKASDAILPGNDFTVVVGLSENNTLTFPSQITKVRDNWGYIFALSAPLLMGIMWFLRGRDKKYVGDNIYYKPDKPLEKSVSVFERKFLPMVYSPINGLSPSEVGVIVDDTVNIEDIVAEIIELARLKFIKVVKIKEKKLFSEAEYAFIKEKEWKVAKINDYQKAILDKIFNAPVIINKKNEDVLVGLGVDTKNPNKPIVLLSSLKEYFFNALPDIKKKLYDGLKNKGVFSANPETVRKIWFIGYIFFSFTMGFITLSYSIDTYNFGPLVVGSIAFCFGIPFSLSMPRKTAWGYSLSRQIVGLREYLKVGKWREEYKENKLFFDEMLPLAISLGVVNKLATDMKDLGIEPPSYFANTSSADFSSDILSFQKGVSYALVVGPHGKTNWSGSSSWSGRSSWSGGSGFSGGGSSGGGFGGGGGGSW